jgi:hypothetical protein
MLRVTVELVPLGDESRAEVIGTAIIANDGTGTHSSGNYRARIHRFSRGKNRHELTPMRCRVGGFSRLDHGPWDLLYLVLKEALHPKHAGEPDVTD